MKAFDVSAYAAKARETVAAGSVLLRNEGALPFAPGSRVAVFGRSQFNYYKSGTGSGGMVNTAPVADITQALEESGDVSVDQGVKAAYEAWLVDHPFYTGQGWAAEPWFQEEMPLDAALVNEAAARNDGAVAIIGRTAGEDQDNSADEGSYYLTAAERDMLAKVCAAFRRVAVVLNVGNIIDMGWVDEFHPQAVLYVWQGGQEGGRGAADVLTGRTFPSGKLSDTIARRLEDYPAFANFGSETRNVYQEDIYVGYRYFETFAPEAAVYPFGFGLGYTTFGVSFGAPVIEGGVFTLPATVVNTGARAGREVVQLYAEKPQGKLGQPARVLVDFAKTPTLAPGESATLTLSCSRAALASYDDSGVTGVRVQHVQSGALEDIALQGCFIAIGHAPNSAPFAGQLEMEGGYITTGKTPGFVTQTSVPGVFAAGDVQDHLYRQAITSAATGCMAALDAQRFLESQG